jgi:hypothetical protein
MEQNQEVLTLATVSTVLEVGRRVLMNMGDDFPVPYRQQFDGERTTSEWVAERFAAAFNRAINENAIVGAAK